MSENTSTCVHPHVAFLDDWPTPTMQSSQHIHQDRGPTPFRKSQLQMLLAINPFGIPSLAFEEAFFKVFKRALNIQQDFGFATLSEMIAHLGDVFAVQVPDETTALLFPDHAGDYILHDARNGRKFCENIEMHDLIPDPENQNTLALLNSDLELPGDICMFGHTYKELYFPLIETNICGTRGVLQVMLVSAANPKQMFVNIRSKDLERIECLTTEVREYFATSKYSMESFLIPKELIEFGFPCLAYVEECESWERSIILGQSNSFNFTVESVDFGGKRTVPYLFLRLMPKRFMEVPRQAILVSLMGVKYRGDEHKWCSKVGSRIRAFSNVRYWLDCVFVENKALREALAAKDESELRKRKRLLELPQFEVLICDRNDEYLDVYLDKILIMENLVSLDDERDLEVRTLREKFDVALKKCPRPKYEENLELFNKDDDDDNGDVKEKKPDTEKASDAVMTEVEEPLADPY